MLSVSPSLTSSPTKSPSRSPTPWPTGAAAPSIALSGAPTTLPTILPTVRPTLAPSTVPTKLPTVLPTHAPSLQPTNRPSITPTQPPTTAVPTTSFPTTRVPTRAPTGSPTSTSPTSVSPTRSPSTHGPSTPGTTINPTVQPSTRQPTLRPSTTRPTTGVPTGPTTRAPTGTPTTATITQAPTSRPTGCKCGVFCTTTSGEQGACQTDGQTCVQNIVPPNCDASRTHYSTTVNATGGFTFSDNTTQVTVPPDPAWGPGGAFTVALTPPILGVPGYGDVLTDILSLDFSDGSGVASFYRALQNPVIFQVKLTPTGAESLEDASHRCEGGLRVDGFLPPNCAWYNSSSSNWDTSGCVRIPSQDGWVGCSCTHLTDFAAVLPHYNPLPEDQLLTLNAANIASHPLGICSVLVVYILFTLTMVYAVRFDHNEQILVTRRDKEAKWSNTLSMGAKITFWKAFKSAMQRKHTVLSLFFRKKGVSFRSVDRTCVTLVAILTCMTMSAHFHGKTQAWVGFVLVILFSSLASILPYVFMEIIFTRIGPPGYKDVFDLEHGIRQVPPGKCCHCWTHYRFPDWFRWPMYGAIFIASGVMTWYILTITLEFDLNDEYVCSGNASSAWIIHVLLSIAANLFVIQPLKIFIGCLLIHYMQPAPPRKEKGMMELHG